MSSTHSENHLIQFSCPSCGKRYSTRREKIRCDEPEFHCQRCEAHFSLNFDEEEGTTQTKLTKAGPRAVVCPKCGALNNAGHEECRTCGVVFSRYKDSDWQMPHSIKGLEIEWREVLNDYENQQVHDEFVALCFEYNSLPFAMQKYQSLIDLIPGDELATEMKSRIRAMAALPSKHEPPVPVRFRIDWMPILMWTPLIIGLILFFFGMKSYEFRNLAGLGAGVIVLTFGFVVYFRK